MDKKKQLERKQLEKFISNEKMNFLVYDITDSETPDFIANINQKSVSIEHTMFIEQSKQQVERYKESVIKAAQSLFNNKYDEDLYVLATLDDYAVRIGKKADHINEIFKLVEEIYLANHRFEFDVSSRMLTDRISNLIEYISINNTYRFNHWQHFGAYTVDKIDEQRLLKVIAKKENNLIKYANNFEENWLLLVANFGNEASSTDLGYSQQLDIKSKFDKIYLYSYMQDSVDILK